jgi:hypothetical protein
MHFYERNLAGRGLDFDDYHEDKPYFVMYAVELRCLNPIVYTKKNPLSPLEDMVEATNILLIEGSKPNKESRREPDKLVQKEGTTKRGPLHNTVHATEIYGLICTLEPEDL